MNDFGDPGGAHRGWFGVDLYRGTSPASVIAAARRQRLTGRGHYRYFNLGAAVLGRAGALADGCDFPTLRAGRVFTPLGMTGSGSNPGGAVPPWLDLDRATVLPVAGRRVRAGRRRSDLHRDGT